MAKLNDEFLDKIAAKIIQEGEPDDLAKFMLSGKENIAAIQSYFNLLETDMKKDLALSGDEWFLGKHKAHVKAESFTGLPLFKLIAPSIIPFVENLHIVNTHLADYSFLKDIKNLNWLWLEFTDDEYTKVLSAFSSLQSADKAVLNFKGLNLQLLSSLSFSFNTLIAADFIFETDPKCDKVFQTTMVHLYGDDELKNDFVFTREHYQNYAAIFPNATNFKFEFYIKIVDDVSDLMSVANRNYAAKWWISNQKIEIKYHFFDYSEYPHSKVLKMLKNDENWSTDGCPYNDAYIDNNPIEVSCNFPLAIAEIGNRLAEQSLRRIPDNSNGKPEDYYHLTLQNEWKHKTEFEILKSTSIKELLKAYGEIARLNHERLRFHRCLIPDGTVADNFQNGDIISVLYN